MGGTNLAEPFSLGPINGTHDSAPRDQTSETKTGGHNERHIRLSFCIRQYRVPGSLRGTKCRHCSEEQTNLGRKPLLQLVKYSSRPPRTYHDVNMLRPLPHSTALLIPLLIRDTRMAELPNVVQVRIAERNEAEGVIEE